MQEDQKPEFVFYFSLIISQIRERGNREFFRLISYLLDIRHRRSKRCRLGIVHRWTSTLETEHAKKTEGRMSKRPYQHLPPLEHRPDGSPYRITPPQKTSQRPDTPGVLQLRGRKLPCAGRWRHLRLSADDFVLRLLGKWFRWAVLPLDRTLKRRFTGTGTGCAECGGVFVPKSNRGKYCRTAPPEFTGGRKQKVNGKGGLLWTVKSGKALICKAPASPQPGRLVSFIIRPGKRASNRPQNTL